LPRLVRERAVRPPGPAHEHAVLLPARGPLLVQPAALPRAEEEVVAAAVREDEGRFPLVPARGLVRDLPGRRRALQGASGCGDAGNEEVLPEAAEGHLRAADADDEVAVDGVEARALCRGDARRAVVG